MSLQPHTGALALDRLGAPDLVETFAFLDRDPVVNVYLIALTLRDGLEQSRSEFWAARREGEIVALLHIGGQSGAVLPLGEDSTALRLLANQAWVRRNALPRRFQVIGPRHAVAPIVERFQQGDLRPRLHRAQTYMSVDRRSLAGFHRLPELRAADLRDSILVFESGAKLREEELDEDPRRIDPIAYARRVEEECRDGYTYLWKDEGGLRFRASVSALTADAAQISGVYTPPPLRNRGIAKRGLSELCFRLFERSRHACLFVNDFNAPALAAYRAVGFSARAAWSSAFYDLARSA